MAKLIKSKSGKLGLLGDDNMVTPIDLNSMNIIRNKSGKYGLLENNQVTPIDSFDIDIKELNSLVSNPFKKKEDTELSSQTDSTAGKSENSFLEDYVFSPIVTGTENIVSSMINFLSGNLDVAYREVVGTAKSIMSKGDIDYLIEKQKKEANPVSNALYEVSGVLSDAAQYGRIDALKSRGVENPEGSFIDDFTEGKISDGISKISYDVVATIPQVITAVAAGGTSAQLGTRFIFPAISATGAAIGEEIQKDNNLSDIDFIQSALKGTIEGIVEAVAIRDLKAVETIGGKIANVLESDALSGIKKSITNIGKKETKDEIVRGVGGILKNAFKGGGEEGLEEVASGIGSFIVDRIDANEPITQQSIFDLSKSLLENFTIGFVSGGALSGVAATASRVPLTQEQQKKIDKFNEIVNDENQPKEIRDIAKQKAEEILKFNADQSSKIYDKIVSLPKETRGEAISYLQQAKKLEEQKSSVKDVDLLNSIEEKIQSYNDNFNKLVEENIKVQEQAKVEEQMLIVADTKTGQIEIPFKFEETMIKPSIKLNVGTVVSQQTLMNKEGIIPTLTPVIQDKLMAYNEALKSIAPETNIVLYNNEQDLAKGIEESGYSVDVAQSTAKESKGLYDPKGNIIHINIAKADPTTLPHEIFHPVVAKIANENPQEFTRMKDTISKRLSESTVSELKQFASQYEGKDVQAEEFLAQLSGLITANKAKFDKPFLYKLALDFKEFIKNIGNKINSKALVKFADSIFTEQTSQQELINFFEGYAKSLQMGKPIDTKVLVDKVVTKEEVDNILFNPKTVRTAEEVTPNIVLKAQRADVTKTPVAGNRLFSDTPLVEAKTIAQEYMDSKGMKYKEGAKIQSVNVERAKRIADAYIAMEDNYSDPQVKEAYDAMISETIDQYKAIIDKGYVVEINNTEPYKNSQEFIDDLRDNKRFKLLSTRASFGDTPITASDLASNPLLQETEYKATNGESLLVNDLFRFVHDFFGHSIRGNSLGAIGEENAWDEHSRMYSPLARRAMTSETRGQNSYVNFSGVNDDAFKLRSYARQLRSEGKIEEANKIVDQIYEMMSFAPQKIGLLPEEFSMRDDEIVNEVQDGRPTIVEDGVVGKIKSDVEPTGNIVNKESLKQQKEDFEFQRFADMEKKVTTGISLKDIGDVIAHLTFSDRLTAGKVNGKDYFGGILFAASTGNWWAAQSKSKANQLVRNAKMNDDGYRYLAPALLSEESHLSNNDMLNSAISLIEDKINQDAVSLDEANSRILKALSLAKTKKYAQAYKDAVKSGLTKENITKGIEAALIGSNSTFDARKDFIKSVLGNANIKVEKRFAGIPSFSEIANYFSEPLAEGLSYGDIPLMIRTKGELSIVEPKVGDPDYHPSYQFVIKSSEPIETIVFDKAYNAVDLYPEVYNSKGELVSFKDNYVPKYGDQAKSRYLNYIGGGQLSTVVSRDIKTAGLKQQKYVSTFQRDRDKLKNINKKSFKEYTRLFQKYLFERNINVKKALQANEMTYSLYMMYNKAGASMFGNLKFEKQFTRIYKGLTPEQNIQLDDLILLRRIIAIDTNFDNREEKRPSHPMNYNKETATEAINALKSEIGEEAFNELNQRANMYFEAFSTILKDKFDAGLIDESTYELYKNYDYMPRKFLEFMFDLEDGGDAKINSLANSFFNAGVGYMTKEELKRIKDGSFDEIYTDSAKLLQSAMVSTERKIATNKALKMLSKEGFQNNAEWVKEVKYKKDSDGFILFDKDGSAQYNKEADKGFRIVFYKEDGIIKPFQMKESYAREFFDEELWNRNSKAYKILQTASGAALLRNMATGLNLGFFISNIPVDVISQVQINNIYDGAGTGIGKQYAKAFSGTLNTSLKMWNKEVLGLDNKGLDDLIYEYAQAGGLMMTLTEEYRTKSKVKILKGISEFLASTGNASELGSKLTAYSNKKQELIEKYKEKNNNQEPVGQDLEDIKTEAVYNARTAMDYHRGGILSKYVDGFVPYLNVMLQGFKITGNYIADNPVKFTSKIFQLGMIQAAITFSNLMLAGDDYDNDDNEFDLINKIVIFMPFKNEDGTRGKVVISVPSQIKGFLNIYQNLAEAAWKKLNGEEYTISDAKIDMYQRVLKMFVPKFDSQVFPPALRSLMEYKTNTDLWRDIPITNDFGRVSVSSEGKEDKNVYDFYQIIGKALDMSPARTQKAVENFIVPSNPLSALGHTLADKIVNGLFDIPEKEKSKASKESLSNVALTPLSQIARRVYKTTDPEKDFSNDREQVNKIILEEGDSKKEIKSTIKFMVENNKSIKELNDYVNTLQDDSDKRTAKNTYEGLMIKNNLGFKDNYSDYMSVKYAGSPRVKAKLLHYYYPFLADENNPATKTIMKDLGMLKILSPEVIRIYNEIDKQQNQ